MVVNALSPEQGRGFRDALGQFATGITVITTIDPDAGPIGITANSFNSVSIDPPMVLWSVAKASRKRECFERAEHFAVNVLAEDQEPLSRAFARGGPSPFDSLAWCAGVAGMPLIAGCAARFECRKVYQYEGGDHLILVGEVLGFESADKPALVFHRGRYGRVRPDPASEAAPPGGFEEDFLMALLMRAAFELTEPFRKSIEVLGMAEDEVRVLTFLGGFESRALAGLAYATMLEPRRVEAALESLRRQGLATIVEQSPAPRVAITEAGRERVIPVLAVAKSQEAGLLQAFEEQDVQRLKRALRRVIDAGRERARPPVRP